MGDCNTSHRLVRLNADLSSSMKTSTQLGGMIKTSQMISSFKFETFTSTSLQLMGIKIANSYGCGLLALSNQHVLGSILFGTHWACGLQVLQN